MVGLQSRGDRHWGQVTVTVTVLITLRLWLWNGWPRKLRSQALELKACVPSPGPNGIPDSIVIEMSSAQQRVLSNSNPNLTQIMAHSRCFSAPLTCDLAA